MPIYFQGVEGTNALTSGIRFMPLVIPQIAAIISSGAVVSKYGYHVSYSSSLPQLPLTMATKVLFMAVGSILAAVGTALTTHIGPDTPSVQLTSFLVIVGLGLGLCMQQPYTAVTLVLE